MTCKSNYFEKGLSGRYLAKVTPVVAKELRKKRVSFQAIAFRGVSGGLFAPCLAAEMGRGLIVVRKSFEVSRKRGDKTHSDMRVEGMMCKRYIIADDFISTGDTVQIIEKKVKLFNPDAVLMAVVTFLNWNRKAIYSKIQDKNIRVIGYKK